MNQPVKVLVIQPHPRGWLVNTSGGRAPHYESIYMSAEEIAADLPRLIQTYLCSLLPPQPETPPPTT